MFRFSCKNLFRPFSTVTTQSSSPPVVKPVIRAFRPLQIFMWRLTPDTQATEIQKTFSQFGAVRSVTIQFDEKTGSFKGSAVVQFTVHEDAQSAIDYYTQRGIVINGQRLAIKWQQSLQRRMQTSSPAAATQKRRSAGLFGPGHQVFVKNLYYSTGEQQLKEAFSAFGEVLFLEVLRDTEGLSRGMARIRFARKEDADTAISGLNGVSFDGRNLIVHFDDQFVSTGEAVARSVGDDSVPIPMDQPDDGTKDAENSKNAENSENAQSFESVNNLNASENNQNPESAQNSDDVQNPEHLQNSDDVENPEHLQNSDDVQNLESVQNTEHAQNPDDVQSTEHVQNPEDVDGQNPESNQYCEIPDNDNSCAPVAESPVSGLSEKQIELDSDVKMDDDFSQEVRAYEKEQERNN